MVLQRLEGLSDREAVDRYAFDVRWRYAAGVGGYARGGWARFAHTVLVDMRERLRRSARPNRIFEVGLAAAAAAGLVGRRRVLDSTPLYDAVATMDTVTLIRSALRALLGAAAAADCDLAVTLRTVLTSGDTLGVPFGSLTATTVPHVEHLRAQDIATVTGSVHAKVLTQAAGARLVEALEIFFPAGQIRRSTPHPKGVVEHILLTEGRLRAGPENALTDIDAGDVLRFPGDVPHSYAALDDKPARAIALDGLLALQRALHERADDEALQDDEQQDRRQHGEHAARREDARRVRRVGALEVEDADRDRHVRGPGEQDERDDELRPREQRGDDEHRRQAGHATGSTTRGKAASARRRRSSRPRRGRSGCRRRSP